MRSYKLRQSLSRPGRNPYAGYDNWKCSPPEDDPELQIRVVCEHCEWEGSLEDAEVIKNFVICPECEEHIGQLDQIIKTAEE